MNVSLTPELESFIQGKVSTGLYYSASEVVREGLRLGSVSDLLEGMMGLDRKFVSIDK
jgi:antitoxin ParD1/3/4